MSIRNGDKSRYHRQRKKRISLRERNRKLLAGAEAGAKDAAAGKVSKDQPAKPKVAR